MREIKFRAWHKLMNKMVQVDAIDFSGGTIRNRDPCAVEDKTNGGCYLLDNLALMQYTGLKDMNDVEIYEGDIIDNHEEYHNKRVVNYDPHSCYFGLINLDEYYRHIVFSSPDTLYNGEMFNQETFLKKRINFIDRIEVVGNIFEGVEK